MRVFADQKKTAVAGRIRPEPNFAQPWPAFLALT